MAVDLRPPPQRATRRTSTATARTASQTTAGASDLDGKAKERKEGLDNYVATGTSLLLLTRQYADASAVSTFGPQVTSEVVKLAARYEKMGETIDKAIAASPFAGLITTLTLFSVQLAVNHGWIKNPGMLANAGIKPKEVLEEEGKAAELRLMREALAAQKRFEEEKALFAKELAEASGNGVPK